MAEQFVAFGLYGEHGSQQGNLQGGHCQQGGKAHNEGLLALCCFFFIEAGGTLLIRRNGAVALFPQGIQHSLGVGIVLNGDADLLAGKVIGHFIKGILRNLKNTHMLNVVGIVLDDAQIPTI